MPALPQIPKLTLSEFEATSRDAEKETLPVRESLGVDRPLGYAPTMENVENPLVTKLMRREKPTLSSLENGVPYKADTAAQEESQFEDELTTSRLHWHRQFRADFLAERHNRKGPFERVAPLQGARVLNQHRHARIYLHSRTPLESKPSDDNEHENTFLDYSVLDVTGMIQHLEGLPTDLIPKTYKAHGLRMTLLSLLAIVNSPTMAWHAYHLLTLLPHPHGVPIEHLHRLSRLLAQQQPRTRRVFLRILSVLRAIHAAGGTVMKWQWNLLLDAAGKGTRKVHLEDFRTALDILDDMRAGRAPGATFLSAGPAERIDNRSFSPDVHEDLEDAEPNHAAWDAEEAPNTDFEREPDTYTHTTLFALAALTRDSRALRRVSALHAATPRDQVTHIVLLSLFAKRHDWSAVRGALQRIGPLGQKAFGVVLWTFASAGRLDVAERMYALTRASLSERKRLRQELIDTDGIEVLNKVWPDAAVYHALIQAYAYQGDLARCLMVFQDMLIAGAHASASKTPSQPNQLAKRATRSLEPTMAAYRAIFLGFYRHGTTSDSADAVWTLPRLLPIFYRFLDLPEDVKPKRTLIFWILSALWRTSGRDADLVLDAVEKLQARFGGEGRWTGRLERMRVMVEDVARAGGRRGKWGKEEDSSSTHQ